MERQQIAQILKQNITTVLPELAAVVLDEKQSLKDLGANSIDRAEIIMLTLSQLQIKIPLIAFANAQNMGGLIDVFCNPATV